MSITIEVDSRASVIGLRRITDGLKDLSQPLRRAGAIVERNRKLDIAAERSPDGAPYAALSPSTLRTKRSGSILRETGRLAASIKANPPAARQVRVVAPTEYGVFHQFGTRKMPARPFMGINGQDESEIRQEFNRFIEGLLP